MSQNFANWLLFFHIAAAIAWIGPALGAWWYLLRNRLWQQRDARPWDSFDDWILSEFIQVLALEHAAFAVLMTTGVLRAIAMGYCDGHAVGPLAPAWLNLKLILIACVIVPFETYDIWLAHWVLPERLAQRHEHPEAFERAMKRHDTILWLGSLVLGIAIPGILNAVSFRPI